MLLNYFKIVLRNLHRQKAYTIINILGLSLSLCCGILVFCFVNYHLGFDHFHHDPDRIYRIVTEVKRDETDYTRAAPPPLGKVFRMEYDYAEKLARIASFDNSLISFTNGHENKKFREPEGVAFTEPEFFDIFNYPLVRGDQSRILREPDEAIITQSIAKKYFGEADPIGKVIRIDNTRDFKITALLKDLPENTGRRTKIYLSYSSLKYYHEWLTRDDSWGGITDELECFLRLRKNISPARVEQAMIKYPKKYRPDSRNLHHYLLQPLNDIHFNPHFGGSIEKKTLWILSFIGFFLIVTAAVNFVNLATAQALRRSREVGVRKVLGSLRGQIFWQFICETGIITLAASIVGLVLATLFLPYLNDWFHIRMRVDLLSNPLMDLFLVILVLVVTFLAGAYPGLILAGFKPALAIKGKISQLNIGGFNTRRSLIILQFVISQILIIVMIVVSSQIRFAKNSDLGFAKDAIAILPIGTGSNIMAMHALENRLSGISNVQSVSLCFSPPASNNGWKTSLRFNNHQEDENFAVSLKAANDTYLHTFDLKLVAGRNLLPADTTKEFLVNETFVKKLNLRSPDEVIGKTISIQGGQIVAPIVGVIKDFHDASFHEDISPICITSMTNAYQVIAVRMNPSNIRNTMAAIEKTWSNFYPDQLVESQFLDEQIAHFYETGDLILKMIQAFCFIAIFIGCLGLYGLVSFIVSQKTKEFGIRKVLGGNTLDILSIFTREFSRLILLSLLIAAPIGGWLMSKWLQDFKFRIVMGPSIFINTLMVSILVAAIAGGYQALRAAYASPVSSIRTE